MLNEQFVFLFFCRCLSRHGRRVLIFVAMTHNGPRLWDVCKGKHQAADTSYLYSKPVHHTTRLQMCRRPGRFTLSPGSPSNQKPPLPIAAVIGCAKAILIVKRTFGKHMFLLPNISIKSISFNSSYK